MKHTKFILAALLGTTLAASAWTGVGTQGQGIQPGDVAAWFTKLGLGTAASSNASAFQPTIGTGDLALSKLAQSGATTGQVLTWSGSVWAPESVAGGGLPSQTGNSGKYLTTNGTVASWATVAGGTTDASALTAGTVAIARGGTGAGTASDARTALGLGTAATVDTGTTSGTIPLLGTGGVMPFARLVNTQTVGDADATIAALARDVLLTTAITAPRAYMLPAASGYPAGARVSFSDVANTLTAVNTATLVRAGSDTINGATSIVLNTAGASPILISDGTSKWNLDIRGVSRGGTGAITAAAARTNLGLGNVDNTSDANKPISTATQTALNSIIREVPCMTKASWSRFTNTSSGILSATSRRRVVAITAAKDLKLVFQNSYGETNGLTNATVKAAVEDDLGTIYPVTFSGSRTATVLNTGTLLISDPVAGLVTGKGRAYFLRVNTSWASGNMSLNVVVDNTTSPGEGVINSVDYTDSGTITTATNYAFSANMVLGTPLKNNPLPTIGFLGDSVMDLNACGGYLAWEDNWTVSALGREHGRNFPYIRLSMGGSTAAAVVAAGSTRRRQFWTYPDIVICNLGLNDCRASTSAATTMANLQTIYRELLAGGVKEIYQCTITPDSSGSNQNAIRVALNALIRAEPNPLTGIIDCADALETARDSNVWVTGYNQADNYHPNDTGGAALRALLKSQLFSQR